MTRDCIHGMLADASYGVVRVHRGTLNMSAAQGGTRTLSGHIFISYSSTDRPYVQRLAQYLQSFGLRVWYDPHITVGEPFAKTIEREIDASAAVIVVMSPAAASSKWVPREMEWAERQNKPVLPLLLAGPVFFQYVHTHYVDVSDGRLPPPQFVAELQRLAALAPRPAAPPAPVYPGPPGPARSERRRRWVVVALVPVVVVCGGLSWGGVTLLRALDGSTPGDVSTDRSTIVADDRPTTVSTGPAPTPSTTPPTGTPSPAGSGQITVAAVGSGPWTVSGYGWRYTVRSIARTTDNWMNGDQPSLTITADVERTEPVSAGPAMTYQVSDRATGTALAEVPFQNTGVREPPLHQVSRLVQVVWDTSPRATRLTVTLEDFYWVDGQDLILTDLPVPLT
jgi:hypothetical protein